VDAETKQALQELERVLVEALSGSAEAALALHQLQQRGYSLYLAVDCDGDDVEEPKPLGLPEPRRASRSEPTFKIDSRDLSFLRSIGIDPTRRLRRRRGD
jgi:hypothetical protein